MKLIVTDLDGTLLNKEKKVSQKNCEVLNRVHKEKNVELVIASGRDIYSIKEVTNCLKVDYHICFNGAKIYRRGELIYRDSMPEHVCEDILKKGRELDLEFTATKEDTVYYTKLDNEYTRHLEKTKHLKLKHVNRDERVSEGFEKIVFTGSADKFKVVREYAERKYGEFINIFGSGDDVIDIVSKNCNKGEAVKRVAKDLGISCSEVMAFGDNENDLSMLDLVGCPVIMGNAKPEYKKSSYNKTSTNEESGVGEFVESYFTE